MSEQIQCQVKTLTEEDLQRMWGAKREAFKEAIRLKMEASPALALLAIETWVANHHRTHIYKIYELLGFYHEEAYKAYCDSIGGEMLTGTDEFTPSLYYIDAELYKMARELPEEYARNDAKEVASSILNELNKKERTT